MLILELLIAELKIIYVEVFVNKRNTISNSVDYTEIEKKILTTFDKRLAEKLIIDVCISTSHGEGKVTLANDHFFKKLN